MERIIKEVTGYCPYLDNENTISAQYKLLSTLGSNQSQYVRNGQFVCQYVMECTYKNNCPLTNKFPKVI